MTGEPVGARPAPGEDPRSDITDVRENLSGCREEADRAWAIVDRLTAEAEAAAARAEAPRLTKKGLAKAILPVLERAYAKGVLRFGSRDDGSGELFMADDIAAAILAALAPDAPEDAP